MWQISKYHGGIFLTPPTKFQPHKHFAPETNPTIQPECPMARWSEGLEFQPHTHLAPETNPTIQLECHMARWSEGLEIHIYLP